MIPNKIRLISPGCPRPNIALESRIVAEKNTIISQNNNRNLLYVYLFRNQHAPLYCSLSMSVFFFHPFTFSPLFLECIPPFVLFHLYVNGKKKSWGGKKIWLRRCKQVFMVYLQPNSVWNWIGLVEKTGLGCFSTLQTIKTHDLKFWKGIYGRLFLLEWQGSEKKYQHILAIIYGI